MLSGPIRMAPLRGIRVSFVATVKASDPAPVPLLLVSVLQGTLLVGVQAQVEGTVTFTVFERPGQFASIEVVESVGVQEAKVNGLEASLRPPPRGPTATTRISYDPPGSGHPATPLEKS